MGQYDDYLLEEEERKSLLPQGQESTPEDDPLP